MKRTAAIIAFVAFFAAQLAAAGHFSVNYRELPVEKVIADLRKQSGYDFVYQKDVFANHPKISAKYTNATLEQILGRIFVEELNVNYEIVDHTVILSKAKGDLPYFKRQITGVVVDENDEPLIGASVFLEGTTNGAATDLDGVFTLTVEGKNPRLRVTYVGMKPQTVTVGTKQKQVMITMKEDAQIMSEVVVTGYANYKRENATGSYQTITSADLDQRHMGSITENLEGKIPGLVTYDNGNGAQMTIRGTGSFEAATSPLVVVDGLPIEGSIESVNPYDIENITVLKDAAAAAIYGARASNGVIVITTKRGKSDKLQVEFNADVTAFECKDYGYMKYASAAEMIELEGYNFNYIKNSPDQSAYKSLLNYYNNGRTRSISPATLLYLRNALGDISDADMQARFADLSRNSYIRDWQRIVETPEVQQQYNLAIRNKAKSLSSSLALNYEWLNNGRRDGYGSNLMFSYNGNWEVFRHLDVAFGLSLLNERSKLQLMHDEFGSETSFLPYYSAYNADGSLAPILAGMPLDNEAAFDPALGLKSMAYNPKTDFGLATRRERRTNVRAYVNATAHILKGWDVSALFQYEDIYYKGDSMFDGESYRMRQMYNSYTALNKATGAVTHYIPDGGMLSTATSEGNYWTFRAQTSYENNFADKHDLNLAAGFEFREQRTRTYGNVMLGYDDQTQTNSNAMVNWGTLKDIAGTSSVMGADYSMYGAPESDSFTTGDILHRFYSLYFTGNYVYDTRYALTASVRLDKCDLFGADPKFRGRPLWSVGASWNMHNEKFLSDVAWIDALKLRVSYGLTGNIANNVSSYLTGTIGINDIYGQKYVTLDTPPNDQLRWEKTATWNAGADFSFRGARLTGALDFYDKSGSDLLTVTDLDPTTGWNSLTINNGRLRNRGVELQLNGNVLRARSRKDVSLSLGFSLAYNHNEVTKVNHRPATGAEALQSNILHKGYPVNSLFSYDFAGMVSDGRMQYYSWRDKEGNIHTSDINSEEFTPEDIVYSGSLDPKWIGSLTPTVRWNGFSLSAMLSGYAGHVMRADCDSWTSDGSQYGFGSLSVIDAVPSGYLDYWRSGDATAYPANGYPGGSHVIGNGTLGNQNVVPADFLKVRNLVFGYQFSDKICRALRMTDLRLRFQANNLCTWARNGRDIDPEANNAISGTRTLRTPRSYTFSVFFSF